MACVRQTFSEPRECVELEFSPHRIPWNLVTRRRDIPQVIGYVLHELPNTVAITYAIEDGKTVLRVRVLLSDQFRTDELQAAEKRIRATIETED